MAFQIAREGFRFQLCDVVGVEEAPVSEEQPDDGRVPAELLGHVHGHSDCN